MWKKQGVRKKKKRFSPDFGEYSSSFIYRVFFFFMGVSFVFYPDVTVIYPSFILAISFS